MGNKISKPWQKSLAALAVAGVLGFSSVVLAADAGGLRIQVLDADGKPVSGAKVHVETPESLVKKDGVTDASGYVNLSGLDPSAKYSVKVDGEGIAPYTRENVVVVSGKSFNLVYTLPTASRGGAEVLEVVGRMQAIDTTSTVVSTDITLDLTESLPTGRSYQSYLQLVPGVKPSTTGNPSSKSGVNYSDIGGTVGSSSDNVYYIDGINVTDGVSGTFGANINSEIIQEQQVFTGAVPAEFEGGSGLVSKVVTKSGSNEFHGSINYYFQDSSLVEANKHLPDSEFSTYDTAITLGGPIIQDKVWFFGSYQQKYREDDVAAADTGEYMRTVDRTSDFGFFKITAQPTDSDRIVLSYFNDPVEISGSSNATRLNNRDLAQEQGGENLKFEYSHSWDNLDLTLEYNQHESDLNVLAANQAPLNNVAFYLPATTPPLAARQLGGAGTNTFENRLRDELKLSAEYFLDTAYGSHTIKVGVSQVTNENELDDRIPSGARYSSIAAEDAGVTLGQYFGSGWTGTRSISSTDSAAIRNAMLASPDSTFYLGLLDSDSNGAISAAELTALVMDGAAGNPDAQVNAYRISERQAAPVTLTVEGTTFFVQDSWRYNDLTINAGVRAEKWEHIASTGETVFTFDWELAPRLGVVYDLNGDGSSKIWGFAGRYYDPIRGNMTDFAGNLTGPVLDEQIFVEDRWLTYRTRGGATTPDALFAPTTKTPYTDEFLLGYSRTLVENVTLDITYTERETRDVLEDYDLDLYTNILAGTALELPLSYFGYSEMPNSNYVIATLAGGERNYRGVELTLRRRKADNWQMLASYTYNDAEGNTNSDSNADFQGDWEVLDPRAPNQYGRQPGNIEHQFKFAGSYEWDNGIELGAVYNWNSGVIYSKTFSLYGRNLPVLVDDAYEWGGYESTWIADDSVGSQEAGAFGTLDLRAKYVLDIGENYQAEFFLDIFNALDDQAGITQQGLVAGDGAYEFGEDNSFVEPRRYYLGARLSF